jgi:hypothetical protein
MINHFVLKLIKPLVGFQSIREQSRACQYMLTDYLLQGSLFRIADNLRADLTAALQDSHNSGLVFAARASDLFRTLALMHVPGFAADVGFVRHTPAPRAW